MRDVDHERVPTTRLGTDEAPRSASPAPRMFGIVATDAPIVAVIRRGPSGWCHVGRWDTERDTFESGSWLHGTIYPQRCDLSPDGRYLAYFALKASARWEAGGTYVAISRLPWLTALAAWGTGGTWTRGVHFLASPRASTVDTPDVGDLAPLQKRFGLGVTRAMSFAVERRRGWTETADTPPRSDDDWWDERRAAQVTMQKDRPGAPTTRLLVSGRYAAFRDMAPSSGPPRYAIATGSAAQQRLEDVQWADWALDGRLIVATSAGRLEARSKPLDEGSVTWSVDLAPMAPAPGEPPLEARRW